MFKTRWRREARISAIRDEAICADTMSARPVILMGFMAFKALVVVASRSSMASSHGV